MYLFNEIRRYLPKPIEVLIEKDDLFEIYGSPVFDYLVSLFPCISSTTTNIFKPIFAAILSHNLIQMANENTEGGYSQIETSYNDAMQWIKDNVTICNSIGNNNKNNVKSIAISKRSRGVVKI